MALEAVLAVASPCHRLSLLGGLCPDSAAVLLLLGHDSEVLGCLTWEGT